ncbi:transcriptional regulator, LysR family [Rubellimicrobium mesophilum DSM 19309]|uniref:Transcriptional regulator, LysR family n=1 Tax=Rubellimicrobium mesophilum DSM 19309 TaxID=442562 RepID=A0A017HSB1_9RHOB|nr:LysR substrate-binding domain-containing protein [Rubellimicrobium mesophilum]EYD77276.1 transcriptional regulator, LysR family [Rubellimicrobium mesophilum DSM 19309]
MPTIRRSVSSLASLAAFEAAARHGSFTLAAAELSVTQAAISRQVKRLEEELNTPLFVRSHRKVELTADGQLLARVMTEAFGRVAETVEAIRQPAPDDTVIVGTTLAFSHFWLVPRLPAFRAAHPGVKLRLISEDAGFDLRQGRVDLVVRYGQPPFADAQSLASMEDEVFPVCSPVLLATIDPPPALGTLAGFPLIRLEWQDPAWLTWPRWAGMAGIGHMSTRSELRFNHYTDAIYAAINGNGVVLGWRRLIAELLDGGRLVRLGGAVAIPVERYHVLRPVRRRLTPPAELFTDWLVGQFGADA